MVTIQVSLLADYYPDTEASFSMSNFHPAIVADKKKKKKKKAYFGIFFLLQGTAQAAILNQGVH